MVKERRAFDVKSIRTTPSTEELQVSNRAPIDYSGMIEAEAARVGTKWNPDFFNTLARVSDDVHTTRRNAANAAFNTQLERYKTDTRFALQEQETELQEKRKRDIRALNREYVVQLEDAKQRAKREGLNYVPMVDEINKKFEDASYKMSDSSPYVTDEFNKYREATYLQYRKDAIGQDADLAQLNATYDLDKSFAEFGRQAATDNLSVDQVMQKYLDANYGQFASITDIKDREKALNYYNAFIVIKAQRTAAMAKAGLISKDAATLAIDAMSNEYVTKSYYARDNEGRGELIDFYMTEETKSSLASIRSGILDDTTQKLEFGGTSEDYIKMATDNFYLSKVNYNTAMSDFTMNIKPALAAYVGGDKSAKKVILDMSQTFYGKVLPTVLGRELYHKSVQITGTAAQGESAIRDLIDQIDDALRNRRDPSTIKGLYIQDAEGATDFYAGMPSVSTDPVFKQYLGLSSVPQSTLEYNYYKQLRDTLSGLLEMNPLDRAAALDPNVQRTQEEFKSASSANALLVTSENSDMVGVNAQGVQELGNRYKQMQVAASSSLGGNARVSGASMIAINQINAELEKIPVIKEKQMYVQAHAQAMLKSNIDSDIISDLGRRARTNEEKAMISELTTNILLLNSPTGRYQLANVYALEEEMHGDFPTLSEIEAKAKDAVKYVSGTETVSDSINKVLDKFNLQGPQRDAARNMLISVTAGNIMGPGYAENNNKKFDLNAIGEQLLADSFTQTGLYKRAPIFTEGRYTVEALEQTLDGTNNILNNTFEKVGAKGIKAQAVFDPVHESIHFKVGNQTVTGIGEHPDYPGTDMVPLQINLREFPADMTPEDKGKIITDYTSTVGTLAILTSADDWVTGYTSGVRVLKQLGIKAPAQDIENMTIQMGTILNELNRPGALAEYVEYLQSEGEDKILTPAPADMVQFALIQSNQDYFDNNASLGEILKRSFTNYANRAAASDVPDNALNRLGRAVDVLVMDHAAVWELFSPDSPANAGFTRLMNFGYSQANNSRLMRLDASTESVRLGEGSDYKSRSEALNALGLRISSGFRTRENSTATSNHPRGLAEDWAGINKGSGLSDFLDAYGHLDPTAMAPVIAYIEERAKIGEIREIGTSYPELAVMCAHIKNKEGKPIVKVYKDPRLVAEHWNHFHVEFYDVQYDKKGNPVPYKQATKKEKTRVSDKELLSYSRPQFVETTGKEIAEDFRGDFTIRESYALADYYADFKPTDQEWTKFTGRPLSDKRYSNRALDQRVGIMKTLYYRNAAGNDRIGTALEMGAEVEITINPAQTAGAFREPWRWGTILENVAIKSGVGNSGYGYDKALKPRVLVLKGEKAADVLTEARKQGFVPIVRLTGRDHPLSYYVDAHNKKYNIRAQKRK